MTIFDAKSYYSELQRALSALRTQTVEQIANRIFDVYDKGQTLFLIGNGGSASLASHMACDLSKGTYQGMRRLRSLAFTDNVEILSAYANDLGYEHVFAEQVSTFARENDTLVCISASGNSQNVLNAVHMAKKMRVFTIGLSGFNGGQLAPLADLCLTVPSSNMQLVEDVHLSVAHCVFTLVRQKIAEREGQLKLPTARAG